MFSSPVDAQRRPARKRSSFAGKIGKEVRSRIEFAEDEPSGEFVEQVNDPVVPQYVHHERLVRGCRLAHLDEAPTAAKFGAASFGGTIGYADEMESGVGRRRKREGGRASDVEKKSIRMFAYPAFSPE